MKTSEAILRAKNGKSLKGIVLDDIDSVQVTVTDALALSNSGIVIPEANVYYDDESIEYDEDIDGVEWSSDFVDLTWEEKEKLSTSHKGEVTINLKLDDVEIQDWILTNKDRIESVLLPIISSLYQAERIVRE